MRKGFTLAELLIVIAIFSLLTVSISPLLRGNQDQAMLSRQTDLVRQHFYETVMQAKTGAAETGITGLPVRGFLLSTTQQEIQSLVLEDGLNFATAKGESLAALRSRSTSRVNLLTTDIGKTSDKPLGRLEKISLDGRETTEVLLLLEPVSNEVALITGSGPTSLPAAAEFTISHATSPRMTRTMVMQPATATITLKE